MTFAARVRTEHSYSSFFLFFLSKTFSGLQESPRRALSTRIAPQRQGVYHSSVTGINFKGW